jgi:hypothetical protein
LETEIYNTAFQYNNSFILVVVHRSIEDDLFEELVGLGTSPDCCFVTHFETASLGMFGFPDPVVLFSFQVTTSRAKKLDSSVPLLRSERIRKGASRESHPGQGWHRLR